MTLATRLGNSLVRCGLGRALRVSFSKEVQQLSVDLIRMRPGYGVWPILYYAYPSSLDQLGGSQTGSTSGHNPVGVAMKEIGRAHV